ncbi:hypothetical protein GGI16_008499, partial [Coemansia sp. S142-1]
GLYALISPRKRAKTPTSPSTWLPERSCPARWLVTKARSTYTAAKGSIYRLLGKY